ncbi:hypothetical protein TIFTF001_037725 [Ficus carica]|uniref:Uncharacterized protein n=1 Tax=Ficus carica TaxID=3494 RepID=A0AA88E5V7_FICCA|nr:hypothetical protein TIFTF001_037716 [Ficus carica]GMN68667.1 hypothetical protein TIFTF001_037725 [Ficus carica]
MAPRCARHPSPPVLLLAPFHVLTLERLEILKIRRHKKAHQPYDVSFPTTNVDDYCILDNEISFSHLMAIISSPPIDVVRSVTSSL